MSWDEQSFLEKVEREHQFPGVYTFRFIVTSKHQAEVEALLPEAEIKLKSSAENKYVSVRLTCNMKSGQEVIKVYKRASKILGIIAL